jgi:hypothetical protein
MAVGLALVAFKWPRALSAPIGVIVAWLGIAWAIRAVKLLRQRPEEGLTLPRDPDAELVERSVTAKRKAS